MASGDHMDRSGLLAKLDELGIETTTVDHPEVMTVEALLQHVGSIAGHHTKNLFMKDKKKRLWLLSASHDAHVDLASLAKSVGAPGGLRFADEAVLLEVLGVKGGCVTAFALINDKEKKVKFVLDKALMADKEAKVHFHPLTNCATTAISPDRLLKFLEFTGHEPVYVEFNKKTD